MILYQVFYNTGPGNPGIFGKQTCKSQPSMWTEDSFSLAKTNTYKIKSKHDSMQTHTRCIVKTSGLQGVFVKIGDFIRFQGFLVEFLENRRS